MSVLGEHDGNGIRYSMHLSAPKGGVAQMLRDPEGGWVSYEDYARLQHQLNYWRIEAETDHARWLRTMEDYARLKAEVERLTIAGDAMAFMAAHRGVNREAHADFMLVIEDWNAAKEGGQP